MLCHFRSTVVQGHLISTGICRCSCRETRARPLLVKWCGSFSGRKFSSSFNGNKPRAHRSFSGVPLHVATLALTDPGRSFFL